jgi:hypothetical protein
MIPRSLQIALGFLIAITVALGIYTVKLKHHAEDLQATASDSLPVTPPAEGTPVSATLVVARDSDASLTLQRITMPMPQQQSMRVQTALRALLTFYTSKDSPHPIGAGSDVRDVYLVGNSLAVIDLNSALAERHRSGIMVENLTVNSIVQTVNAIAPEVRQVRFLVDGKERETLAGHADLRMTYNVAATPSPR